MEEENLVRVCKLEDKDIFTTDFFTFLSEELYKSPCFHPMTREEIEKHHFLPPMGYGLIMVRFDKNV